jgi:glyoxylase-like metal-dependent hydrolase (beta-lactamase superfamily II)
MLFRQLFDRESNTYTYLIADQKTAKAILIDSVLEQLERDYKILQELGLSLCCCLETHVHADHITGTGKLRELTGCLGIVPDKAEVNCADRHIKDGEILEIGSIKIEAISTPGHTDSHFAYYVNNLGVFTGDALLIRGCGRTDFQSGDAGALYDSVTGRIFTLPDTTLVYPGHDYRGHTVSSISEEKHYNPRFVGRSRSQFIEFMNNLKLPLPMKIMEAVPANESCGSLNNFVTD